MPSPSSWTTLLLVLVGGARSCSAFCPSPSSHRPGHLSRPVVVRPLNGVGDFFKNLGQAVDDFVDDAMDRKLGNGASFYGKRKSGFYGDDDSMKKEDPRVARADEDYQGPSGAGYFTWGRNEDGQMQPQTRMKKKPIERLIDTDGFPRDGMRDD